MDRPEKEMFPLTITGSDGLEHVLAYNIKHYSEALDNYIDWLEKWIYYNTDDIAIRDTEDHRQYEKIVENYLKE